LISLCTTKTGQPNIARFDTKGIWNTVIKKMMSNTESPEVTTPEIVPLTEEEIAQFFQESAAVLAAQKRAAAILAAKKKALADGIAAGKPIKIEVNCETGEEIVSLLTNEEVSVREVEVAL